MNVEIAEVAGFLAAHEPFMRLPEPARAELAAAMEIIYVRRGEDIITPGHENAALYVIRSGAVDVIGEDVLLDRRDAGRSFGYSTLVNPEESRSRYRMTAVEDSLLLVIPAAVFRAVAQEHPDFQRFYSSQTLRIRQAAAQLNDDGFATTLRSPVLRPGDSSTAPLVVKAEDSIQSVAADMDAGNHTAALVSDGTRIVGIITDKDLRGRVVARGVATHQAVATVMTVDPVTVTATATVMDALVVMSERNISHLPVLGEEGASVPVGLVTNATLMELLRNDPVYLIADIARHKNREELVGTFERATHIVARFIERGASPADAARMMTIAADGIAQRLVALAYEELGPAPVEYAFVTVGSQGRHETGFASDQDNALILADTYQPELHGDYFAALTDYVCTGLADAGQRLCPGDMMANQPQWRMTIRQWHEAFAQWVTALESEAVLQAQVFFDMRTVAGSDSLTAEVHSYAVAAASGARRFHAHLAALAARREPPLGFFRGFVVDKSGEYAKTLDIKKGGVAGIVQMARLHAISGGSRELDTRARLQAAAGQNISEQGANNLIDAFDFLTAMSLRHQAQQLREGAAPDNHIDPAQLSKMEREHLRDAFQIVGSMYKALATKYPVRST